MDKRDEIKKLANNICKLDLHIRDADHLYDNSILNLINVPDLQQFFKISSIIINLE